MTHSADANVIIVDSIRFGNLDAPMSILHRSIKISARISFALNAGGCLTSSLSWYTLYLLSSYDTMHDARPVYVAERTHATACVSSAPAPSYSNREAGEREKHRGNGS